MGQDGQRQTVTNLAFSSPLIFQQYWDAEGLFRTTHKYFYFLVNFDYAVDRIRYI